MNLREAWDGQAERWIAWTRAPDHDSYDVFHRDLFMPLVPPAGSLTVDLGCGEGRLARHLISLGHRVLGLDGSPRLARAALEFAEQPVPACAGDAAALPFRSGSADLVVAFMVLQDIDDVERAVSEVARILREGGRFVIAIVHPLNSAGAFLRGPAELERPFVIDRSYFVSRPVSDEAERDGLAMTFHAEHRPIGFYVDALTRAGFVIEALREIGDPDPMSKWSKIPYFLHLLARKHPAS